MIRRKINVDRTSMTNIDVKIVLEANNIIIQYIKLKITAIKS